MENLFRTGKNQTVHRSCNGEKQGRDNTSTSSEPSNPNWRLPPSPRSADGTSWEGSGAGKGSKAKESFYTE